MSEYADAGVDYRKLESFKVGMIEVVRKTATFPTSRGVTVLRNLHHAHGGVFTVDAPPGAILVQTTEGLGNKNWIAEWMIANANAQGTYVGIGIDTGLMAVNDVIAQGAMPVTYTDEVAGGDSDWFLTDQAKELAEGFFQVCQMCGMALVAGESPSLRYLINAAPPVKSAPSLSGTVIGIIPRRELLVDGSKLQVGDHILGAPSSGLHANGISLVIKRAMGLPDQFLTQLPNGNSLGAEALIPTRCYVGLVEALQEARIEVHSFLPGTGSGVSKIAFDQRPFTYRIYSWVEVPVLFQFMRQIGVSLVDCLTTFNWGIGYYIFVSAGEAELAIQVGQKAGFELHDVGVVEEGERKVIFEPKGITLPPPGE